MMSSINEQPSQPMPGDPNNRDNSQFWVAGVFYVNHDDPRLLVEKRSGKGAGWTFNFAHRAAWWLMGGLIALIGLIVAFGLLLPHLLR